MGGWENGKGKSDHVMPAGTVTTGTATSLLLHSGKNSFYLRAGHQPMYTLHTTIELTCANTRNALEERNICVLLKVG